MPFLNRPRGESIIGRRSNSREADFSSTTRLVFKTTAMSRPPGLNTSAPRGKMCEFRFAEHATGEALMATDNTVVLSSWKEIAAYLNKGVRTVQRWEGELSLPIRRPVAHNRRIVIAVPAELDSWVQQQVTRNSAAHQVPVNGDSAFRAQMARLTETLQRLHNTSRHLQLTTERIGQERRHGRELRAALRHTRSSLAAQRQTRRQSQ